jgi:hypothetical protein
VKVGLNSETDQQVNEADLMLVHHLKTHERLIGRLVGEKHVEDALGSARQPRMLANLIKRTVV